MGQLTARQAGLIMGGVLLLLLIAAGRSDMGRRTALSAARPFASGWDFVSGQARTLFASSEKQSGRIAELEEQVEKLTLEVREARQLREENQQLRRASLLRARSGWSLIRAEVLTRDPTAWDVRFTLDKGSSEGVTAGACVLFEGTLAGRVTEVGAHVCTVETVVSPRCHVGVTLGDTNYHGLLQGVGRCHGDVIPGCLIDCLPLAAEAQKDWVVSTSGLGGEVPSGLPVARICLDQDGAAIQEVDHARKQVVARPLVNWDTMRVVSIVCGK